MQYEIVRGAFTQDDFIDFFSSAHVMDSIMPNDILIFDNCSIHHTPMVEGFLKEYCAALGAYFLYLPPYSPQLNPIEYAFGCAKMFCRHHLPHCDDTDELVAYIEIAVSELSTDQFTGWYRHCGYI